MSTYLRWDEIRNQFLSSEVDLEAEDSVDEPELRKWANDAIREAEALIHTIYEDYFLTKAVPNLELVQGEENIAVPPDLYASKIRGIVYTNDNRIYEVKRIKDWNKFLKYRLGRFAPTSTEEYQYFITNTEPGNAQITLTPPAQESGLFLECWYLRNANRMETNDSVCDIPEFVQFVFDHMRVKQYEKESHFALPKAIADKEATKKLMVETLTSMVPDTDTELEPDLTAYEEMS